MTDIWMNSPPGIDGRRQRMRTPDKVLAILRLHDQGWGTRRIAWEVGCDRQRPLALQGRFLPEIVRNKTLFRNRGTKIRSPS